MLCKVYIISLQDEPELEMEVRDFVLFFSKKDTEAATDFFNKVTANDESHDVKVTGYMPKENMLPLEYVRNYAVQVWLFITDNFASDEEMENAKNEELIRAVNAMDSRKVTMIPIWTKPKEEYVDIPYGLASVAGLYTTDHDAMMSKVHGMFKSLKHMQEKKKMLRKPNIADFLLYFSKGDEEKASAFVKDVLSSCKNQGNVVSGYLYNDANLCNLAETPPLEIARKYSVQIWIYFTGNFICDTEMEKIRNGELIKSIKMLDDRSVPVIPIWTKPKESFNNVPYGFAAMEGLNPAQHSVMISKIEKMFSKTTHKELKRKLQTIQNA